LWKQLPAEYIVICQYIALSKMQIRGTIWKSDKINIPVIYIHSTSHILVVEISSFSLLPFFNS
jgi:hypothetical protein